MIINFAPSEASSAHNANRRLHSIGYKAEFLPYSVDVSALKMHMDIRPELHTPECNELVNALLKCYKENPFGRIFGACDKANAAMEKCFHKEQEERRLNNSKYAREQAKKAAKKAAKLEE